MSTFGISVWLLKWLPVRLVDRFLLAASRLILGDTARLGLNRPSMGPLEQKNRTGKTPVLDVGTLEKIEAGEIKVQPPDALSNYIAIFPFFLVRQKITCFVQTIMAFFFKKCLFLLI